MSSKKAMNNFYDSSTFGTSYYETFLDTACRQFNHMLTFHRLKMNPKIDLHRHFEGSLRLESLVKIAKEYDMDLPHSIDELRPLVQMVGEKPAADNFLGKFKTLRHFYRNEQIIWDMAYQIVEDAAIDNISYLELRFSPQALSNYRGFPMDYVTDIVIDATRKAAHDHKIMVNLIITLVRHDPIPQAKKVAEVAFRRFNNGIVGIDLAGDAMRYPAHLFEDIFKEAQRQGLGITVHAGEWMPAHTVQHAIETLGADRIGHGVRSIDDENVISILKERDIALEMCLTSNLQTAAVSDLRQHPMKALLRKNVKVTLNTDDPSISDITLTDEMATAIEYQRMSYTRFYQMTQNGVQAAFLPSKTKKKLSEYIKARWSDEAPYQEMAQQFIQSAPERMKAALAERIGIN